MSPAADSGVPRSAGNVGALAALRSGQKLTLHLGVIEQPYRSRSGKSGALTTGDVAEILEHNYGVMGAFVRVHGDDVIGKALEDSLAGAIEALAAGQAVDPWGRGMQRIGAAFREFISSGEAERVGIPGTPTAAALRGVNHRLAHPYRMRNKRRPSFRDTGLYMASMRAWID